MKILIIIMFLLFNGCNTVSEDVGPLMSQWVVHYNNISDTIIAQECIIENIEDSRMIRFFVDGRVVGYFNFDVMGNIVDIEHVKSYK